MHFCGLDVSLRERAICIVDAEGRILKEAKIASDPDELASWVTRSGYAFEKIGLESGSTSAWLQAGLVARGLPAICIDARHASAMLQAGLRNKSDRSDARGIADGRLEMETIGRAAQLRTPRPACRRFG